MEREIGCSKVSDAEHRSSLESKLLMELNKEDFREL